MAYILCFIGASLEVEYVCCIVSKSWLCCPFTYQCEYNVVWCM